jgi:hypothetical protein
VDYLFRSLSAGSSEILISFLQKHCYDAHAHFCLPTGTIQMYSNLPSGYYNIRIGIPSASSTIPVILKIGQQRLARTLLIPLATSNPAQDRLFGTFYISTGELIEFTANSEGALLQNIIFDAVQIDGNIIAPISGCGDTDYRPDPTSNVFMECQGGTWRPVYTELWGPEVRGKIMRISC